MTLERDSAMPHQGLAAAHNQSLSTSQTPPEPRTPGEYALHHLFHSFVVRADAKISQCLATIDVTATPVEQACGAGADATFDQLIGSLGHISRQNPKPLVDSLMLWRKNKGDHSSCNQEADSSTATATTEPDITNCPSSPAYRDR